MICLCDFRVNVILKFNGLTVHSTTNEIFILKKTLKLH